MNGTTTQEDPSSDLQLPGERLLSSWAPVGDGPAPLRLSGHPGQPAGAWSER